MSTLDELKKGDEPYLKADGFDDALIGFAWHRNNGMKCAIYDRNKCIEILMQRDDMSEEDATEFFEFNVQGAYVGPQTPFFVDSCERGE